LLTARERDAYAHELIIAHERDAPTHEFLPTRSRPTQLPHTQEPTRESLTASERDDYAHESLTAHEMDELTREPFMVNEDQLTAPGWDHLPRESPTLRREVLSASERDAYNHEPAHEHPSTYGLLTACLMDDPTHELFKVKEEPLSRNKIHLSGSIQEYSRNQKPGSRLVLMNFPLLP
jgi:hypothetical protein